MQLVDYFEEMKRALPEGPIHLYAERMNTEEAVTNLIPKYTPEELAARRREKNKARRARNIRAATTKGPATRPQGWLKTRRQERRLRREAMRAEA